MQDNPNCDSYEWELVPAEAGNLSISGDHSCIVEWSGAYTGNATLKARVVNICGKSDYGQVLNISVGSSYAVHEHDNDLHARIFPNPGKGIFEVEIKRNVSKKLALQVINLNGNVLYEKEVTEESGNKFMMDLSNFAEGIYFLILESDGMRSYKKIIVYR
jgi:hypothetical protein